MTNSFATNSTDNPYQLSLDQLKRIDHVCIEFERQLRNNAVQRIEDILALEDAHPQNTDSEKWRRALLTELLLIEIEYRERNGKSAIPRDYLKRFPDDTETIHKVLTQRDAHPGNPSSEEWQGELPVDELNVESRFHLKRFHAQGGLGAIYIANDPQHHREVVVKFPRLRYPEAHEQMRLQREAVITGSLQHPGIVPVYATRSGQHGTPCYVMQFVEGETLDVATKKFHERSVASSQKFQSMEFRRLLQRLVFVCNTVAYAHSQEVIHRDIKPQNILLGGFDQTILLDWGLAKRIHDKGESTVDKPPSMNQEVHPHEFATTTGLTMGTPAYASPEQVMGELSNHSEASDVYSLGATLFQVLTNQRPLNSSDELTGLESWKRLPKPKEVDNLIPAALDAICRKAMSPEQKDRYASVVELSNDLQKYLADQPIAAFRDSWLTTARRWASRRPRISAALAASLIVGVLALAIGSILLQNERSKLTSAYSSLSKSNQDLELAIEDATKSRNEAISSFRWLTDHGIRNSFASKETLDNRHHSFLKEVRKRYRDYAKLQPNDASGNAIRGEGQFRIAQVHNALGEYALARDCLQKACELLDKSNLSDSKDLQIIAGRTHLEYGLTLYETGEIASGTSQLRLARKNLIRLLAENPDDKDIIDNLAIAGNALASLNPNPLTWKERHQMAMEAQSYAEQLVASYPKQPDYSHLLAGILNNRGMQHYHRNELDKAKELFETATAIHDPLVVEYPRTARFRSHRAISRFNTARVLLKKRKFQAAAELANQCVLDHQNLIASFPQVPAFSRKAWRRLKSQS